MSRKRFDIKHILDGLKPAKLQIWFLQHPVIIGLSDWSKRNSFPGFFDVPLYDVFIFLKNEISGYSITTRANSIAFSFFIALFPALLVLFTLVPYFSDLIYSFFPQEQDYTVALVEQLNLIIPGIDIQVTNENALEEAVENNIFTETLQDIIETPRYGLLSLGFVLAIFFSSNGMLAMMNGFEKASYVKTFKKRTGFKNRMVAIGLTFLLGFLLILSVLLLVLGGLIIEKITDYFNSDSFVTFSLGGLRILVFVALFYFGIALIYRYGAATYKRFKIFSPGVTLATLLSIISSLGFGYYIENFSQYNRLYGSIGTVIILLLWLQINAFIILAGFELNAGIAVNRDLKEKREET